MISTQLDLFGGPPKPPKNIREEEPQIVAQPIEEKKDEPYNEPEGETPEVSLTSPKLDEEEPPELEELPEWIAVTGPETDIEMDEEPAFEPVHAIEDESLSEVEPHEIVATFDEPGDEKGDATEPETVSVMGNSPFNESAQKIEEETEPESEPDAIEKNETPFEVEDGKDYENNAKETLDIPNAEDSVHVQLPSHNTGSFLSTALIPVGDFVVDENHIAGADDIQPENLDNRGEDDNELSVLDSDAGEIEKQVEEPLSPPFMVDAIATENVIIGGEHDVNMADGNTDTAIDTKEGHLQIPEDEKLFLRQYYTMRETSNMFGVNQSLLRYWENEFDVLKPKKNRKGDRYFRPEDIKNLELIYHLLKVRKFTIEGAREYIKSKKKVLDTFELVQKLEKLKFFLHELKTHL